MYDLAQTSGARLHRRVSYRQVDGWFSGLRTTSHLAARIGRSFLAIAIAMFTGSIALADDRPVAEIILRGGKIVTLDPHLPQAQAIALAGARILAVGDNAAIDQLRTDRTRLIELGGRLVVPGFVECHGHLLGLGQAKLQLDLVGTQSQEQIAQLVAQRAAKAMPLEWITGRGWDQNDWPDKAFPTHHSLTAAAPNNPVVLTRIDGHAVWVNAAAMKHAGLTKDTAEVPGGKIIRDSDGHPTGVLIDRAAGIVTRHAPELSRQRMKEALRLAIDQCLAHGITTFHDAGTGGELIELYRELLSEGQLPLRMYVLLWGSDRRLLQEHFRRGPEVGLGQGFLTIRAIKLMADGALGSRGAALFDPYDDAPGYSGLLILSEDQVFTIADQALRHGFQVCTHAIGDRANRLVLDAYARAFAAHPQVKDPRFRIEHAQILDDADIPRFAKLGVIASMQATHCTSDMPWVPDRIGPARTLEGAYVWRKLLDSGARICNGSDAPVEHIDPLRGFYAAVTRQDLQGKPPGGWQPDQRMTRQEALRSFTSEGAYAGFEEQHKGRLAPGLLADLIVLSHDILTQPEPRILDARVDLTIVGGKVRYDRAEREKTSSP
jgi:hypothetical protein